MNRPRESVVNLSKIKKSFIHEMITDEVIKEIYRKFRKPPKDEGELNLDYFVGLLKEFHPIQHADGEIIIGDPADFSPFKRFLARGLMAVLEFDKWVAFVFRNHILFLSKTDSQMQVHIKKEEEKTSLFDRIFGKGKK